MIHFISEALLAKATFVAKNYIIVPSSLNKVEKETIKAAKKQQ